MRVYAIYMENSEFCHSYGAFWIAFRSSHEGKQRWPLMTIYNHVLRATLSCLYWALYISMFFERLYTIYIQLPEFFIHIEIWISFTLSHESHQMKELPDDRTSGVVVCLLVVHAPSVIGRWTSTGLWSTHRPWARVWNVLKVRNGSRSSGDSSSESSSWLLVRVVFSQWVYVSWKRRT